MGPNGRLFRYRRRRDAGSRRFGEMTEHVAFESRLSEARDRFLARVIEHGFVASVRTAADFLRHFPPAAIMHALASDPDRRARILQETIGLRPRIALKKTPESSGEDLQIALEEGETDAASIVRLFHPDDRVRFLDARLLWAYVVESSHVGGEARQPEVLKAIRSHTAFIIEEALREALLRPRDVITGIGVPALVDRLPREEIATLLERALDDGRDELPFLDATLLDLVSLPTICTHVPLATLWDWVIGAKIAVPLQLLGEEAAEDFLFDATEAHPDASKQVTVIIDPAGTEPHGMVDEDEPRLSRVEDG
jgi:hypothetical protein